MTKNTQRVRSGVPDGGQFAATSRAESDVALTSVHPPLVEHPFVPGSFSVLDACRVTTSRTDGYVRTDVHHGGAPDLRSGAKTAGLRIQVAGGGDYAVRSQLHERAEDGGDVTVLFQSPSGDVTAAEGTVAYSAGGELVLVAKGRAGASGSVGQGTYLTKIESEARKAQDAVRRDQDLGRIGTSRKYAAPLAVMSGHGHAQELADQYRGHVDAVPALGPVSVDGIPQAQADREPPSDVAAVFVLDHPGFDGSQDGRGTVFFATDLDPGDGSSEAWGEGIVNGYTVFSPTSGMDSEHGSMYVSDLTRLGGRVQGYRPGALTFSDAMALGRKASAYGDGDIEATWSAVRGASE